MRYYSIPSSTVKIQICSHFLQVFTLATAEEQQSCTSILRLQLFWAQEGTSGLSLPSWTSRWKGVFIYECVCESTSTVHVRAQRTVPPPQGESHPAGDPVLMQQETNKYLKKESLIVLVSCVRAAACQTCGWIHWNPPASCCTRTPDRF